MVLRTRARLLMLVLSTLVVQQTLLAQDDIFDDGLGEDTTTTSPGAGFDDLGGGLEGTTPQDDPRAQYEAAVAAAEQLREQGDFPGALAAYKQLEQLAGPNPAQRDPRVLYGIAYCHQQLGATDLAISYYSQAPEPILSWEATASTRSLAAEQFDNFSQRLLTAHVGTGLVKQ